MGYISNEDILMNLEKSYKWYSIQLVPTKTPKEISSSRDIFQARLSGIHADLLRQFENENEVALLIAVIGEIGNNCFDHNIGQWKDIQGCWFQYEIIGNEASVVISDRGQGILSSLKKAIPHLKDDQMAVETAFEKKISGRSPEKRGNGLKFVRSIINGHAARGLIFISGSGQISLGGLSQPLSLNLKAFKTSENAKGTFAVIGWKINHEN